MISNKGIILQSWLNVWNNVKNTLGIEFVANRDANNGYPSLSGFALKLKNTANTFTSTLSNTATAARAWTMPDKDGVVAMLSDISSGVFSSGSVIFSNGTQLDQDNSNLYYDKTLARIGLATATPGQRLDIKTGGIKFTFSTPMPAILAELDNSGAGNIPNGTYVYRMRSVNAHGESVCSVQSAPITVTNNTTNGKIRLTLPISEDKTTVQRRLFRSNDNGANWTWYANGTISNNTTTTFIDNVASLPNSGIGGEFSSVSVGGDSGIIYADTVKAIRLLNTGELQMLTPTSANSGRATDNNGVVGFGVGVPSTTTKSGIYVSDNFNFDSGSAYIAAVQSNSVQGTKSLFKGYKAASANTLPSSSGGAVYDAINQTFTTSNSSICYRAQILSINTTNTGTNYGFLAYNFIQGTAVMSNYSAFESTGVSVLSTPACTNWFDFRASPITYNEACAIQNRYGVYISFTNTNIANAYGIYQVSPTLINFFGGKIGVGTVAPTNDISLGGQVPRSVGAERITTANSAGVTVVFSAGGATSGATNKNGGTLMLSGGISTGTGESGVQLVGYVAGASGTADNTAVTALETLGNKIGFYGATPATKPTISGSRMANPALADLLTKLATLGLITDATTI
jgi:hypothetical protein